MSHYNSDNHQEALLTINLVAFRVQINHRKLFLHLKWHVSLINPQKSSILMMSIREINYYNYKIHCFINFKIKSRKPMKF
jgi:hypothetical protein